MMTTTSAAISFWSLLSLVGSMAVMGPAGVFVGAWLALGKHTRLAMNWVLLFGAGMVVVVLTKLAFMGWGVGIASISFAGFSGHAMRASAVLPVLFYLLFKHLRPSNVGVGVALGALLAVLITVSRLELGAHPISEAMGGSLLGFGIAWLFIRQAHKLQEFRIHPVLAGLGLCGLLMAPHVEPVPTEELIERAALILSGHDHTFSRYDFMTTEQRILPQ
jgi:membrane-associated phospholipid phosphatase